MPDMLFFVISYCCPLQQKKIIKKPNHGNLLQASPLNVEQEGVWEEFVRGPHVVHTGLSSEQVLTVSRAPADASAGTMDESGNICVCSVFRSQGRHEIC